MLILYSYYITYMNPETPGEPKIVQLDIRQNINIRTNRDTFLINSLHKTLGIEEGNKVMNFINEFIEILLDLYRNGGLLFSSNAEIMPYDIEDLIKSGDFVREKDRSNEREIRIVINPDYPTVVTFPSAKKRSKLLQDIIADHEKSLPKDSVTSHNKLFIFDPKATYIDIDSVEMRVLKQAFENFIVSKGYKVRNKYEKMIWEVLIKINVKEYLANKREG